MTQFLEKSLHQPIDIATSGDNLLIAAPGVGHYLAIDFLQVFVPTSVGVILKHGSTNFGGKYAFASGQNITIENGPKLQDGILTCGDNESFTLNLDANQQCSGFMRYRIVGN